MPGKELAPKAVQPEGIKGKSIPVEVNEWLTWGTDRKAGKFTLNGAARKAIEEAVKAVYPGASRVGGTSAKAVFPR